MECAICHPRITTNPMFVLHGCREAPSHLWPYEHGPTLGSGELEGAACSDNKRSGVGRVGALSEGAPVNLNDLCVQAADNESLNGVAGGENPEEDSLSNPSVNGHPGVGDGRPCGGHPSDQESSGVEAI